MDMTVGDTFLYEYPNSVHLHVVVTEMLESGNFLCVFISSIKAGMEYDDACVLHGGDIPFIRHDSYVVYQRIICFDATGLNRMVMNGTCKRKEKVSDDVLERIIAGAKKSEYLQPRYLKYFTAADDRVI